MLAEICKSSLVPRPLLKTNGCILKNTSNVCKVRLFVRLFRSFTSHDPDLPLKINKVIGPTRFSRMKIVTSLLRDTVFLCFLRRL